MSKLQKDIQAKCVCGANLWRAYQDDLTECLFYVCVECEAVVETKLRPAGRDVM